MNAYMKVIDLTSKPASERSENRRLKEPSPPLPEVSIGELPPALREATGRLGWASLMPVQRKAIPYFLAGRDLMVQSRTGSGKTGAFLLPLLDKLDPDLKKPQALILTPTRELARQIFDEFSTAVGNDSPLKPVSVYGGVGYGPQIQAINAGAQVVVGTPGRILDLLSGRRLKLDALKVLILDEADEMLSVGFWPAMKDIKSYLPRDRESYMFSATIPYKVEAVADEFLRGFGFLSLGRVSVDKMTHRYAVVAPMNKNRGLVRFIELENPDSAIVFVNTKRRVEYLTLYLQQYGFEAMGLSGDHSQKDREKVMRDVKDGKIRFLVATDVAARGIDISGLSHIWMYDVPQDPEYYVHRAGRTARAGESGEVIALATVTDEHVLKSIAKHYGLELDKVEEPAEAEVESHVSARVIELLEAHLRELSRDERGAISQFVPLVEVFMAGGHVHWLSMLFDGFYHDSLHSFAPPKLRLEPNVQLPSSSELESSLNAQLEELGNLRRGRLLRFETLVEQLIQEGEPELPAMLLADFWARRIKPQEPSLADVKTRSSKRGGSRRRRR